MACAILPINAYVSNIRNQFAHFKQCKQILRAYPIYIHGNCPIQNSFKHKML